MTVGWVDVLDGLAVLMEDVDPDNGFVELWIGGLDDLVVLVLHVVKGIKPFQDKLEDCFEVFRTRGGDEYV